MSCFIQMAKEIDRKGVIDLLLLSASNVNKSISLGTIHDSRSRCLIEAVLFPDSISDSSGHTYILTDKGDTVQFRGMQPTCVNKASSRDELIEWSELLNGPLSRGGRM
jgi:hypothetical protein